MVTESAVIRAMVTALTFFKIVAEPGGAAALASAISGMVPVKGRTIVAIISGGNVDADVYADLVARGRS